jgi:hypothetical protein
MFKTLGKCIFASRRRFRYNSQEEEAPQGHHGSLSVQSTSTAAVYTIVEYHRQEITTRPLAEEHAFASIPIKCANSPCVAYAAVGPKQKW